MAKKKAVKRDEVAALWERRTELMKEVREKYPNMDYTNADLYVTSTMNYDMVQPTRAKMDPATGRPVVVDSKVVLNT